MLRLILPDTRYLASYAAALREGYYLGIHAQASEEAVQEIEKDPFTHFAKQNQQGGVITPPGGVPIKRVPHTLFWLVDEKDFIGGVSIRYELNEFLQENGGHIGFGIRPSKQRQGMAKEIIRLSLQKIADIDVKTAVLTADVENPGSWKAIEACGGVLIKEKPSLFHPGNTSRLYHINLTTMRDAHA